MKQPELRGTGWLDVAEAVEHGEGIAVLENASPVIRQA
jgi:hypothetical protein